MIGRNPEVATQPLFFGKWDDANILVRFATLERKEQRVFATEHGFQSF